MADVYAGPAYCCDDCLHLDARWEGYEAEEFRPALAARPAPDALSATESDEPTTAGVPGTAEREPSSVTTKSEQTTTEGNGR